MMSLRCIMPLGGPITARAMSLCMALLHWGDGDAPASAPNCSAWFQSLLCRVTLCSNVRCTQEWKLSDTAVIRQANASAWIKSLKEKQKTKSKEYYKQMGLCLPHLVSPTPP